MSDLEELLKLGTGLLNQEQDASQYIQLLDRYCAAFNSWYQTHEQTLISGKLSAASAEQLAQLARNHETILKMAEERRARTLDELKALRLKGKGIKAYAAVGNSSIKRREV